VWDSPNSAGIVIDAIRCAKLAMDRGVGGPIIGPSAYFMKSPPVQFSDDAARDMVEEFIQGNGASKAADWSNFFDLDATDDDAPRDAADTVQVVEGGDTIEVSEPIGDPARTSS